LGALDALTRRAMRGWLLDVWQSFRKTVILVTHDIEEAIYLSDRVYVMSPRPGTIMVDLTIALPRPRTGEITQEPQFLAYQRTLLNSLGV